MSRQKGDGTVDPTLEALLHELAQFGETHDAAAGGKMAQMRNITPDTGSFLSLMIQAVKARRILEVGTSNGYSTLWLADAARQTGGHVTTLELLPAKAELARANFARSGLEDYITLHVTDAGAYLAAQPDHTVDFLFLDSERVTYPAWWPAIQRVLVPGGLIICDNAISHAHELQPFADLVKQAPGYQSQVLPIGKGELLILKGAVPA